MLLHDEDERAPFLWKPFGAAAAMFSSTRPYSGKITNLPVVVLVVFVVFAGLVVLVVLLVPFVPLVGVVVLDLVPLVLLLPFVPLVPLVVLVPFVFVPLVELAGELNAGSLITYTKAELLVEFTGD